LIAKSIENFVVHTLPKV